MALATGVAVTRTRCKRSVCEDVYRSDATYDELDVPLDECLQTYGDLGWSIAKRFCNSTTDAEDAAQDVFVELWQKADRFDPEIAGESTFIAMIARRRLIVRLRKTRSKVDVESFDLNFFPHEDHSQGKAELQDEAAKAVKCLDRLPDQQQQVIALSVHQGASHRVIAQQLNIPLGTVKTIARRGLTQIWSRCQSDCGQ